jgi:hypothetical protein
MVPRGIEAIVSCFNEKRAPLSLHSLDTPKAKVGTGLREAVAVLVDAVSAPFAGSRSKPWSASVDGETP